MGRLHVASVLTPTSSKPQPANRSSRMTGGDSEMTTQTTVRKATVNSSNIAPRRGPKRRLGVLVGALAITAVGAFGAARPVAADSSIWTGLGGEHDQGVVCNFQTHTVYVVPRATVMDGYYSGQNVATRVVYRDVTANGQWIYTGWTVRYINSYLAAPAGSNADYITRAVTLPSTQFATTRNHQYSVFVEYYYANANGVWTWDDMHATSPYEMVTSSGLHISSSYCQAGF
jgi:hypothetical protein